MEQEVIKEKIMLLLNQIDDCRALIAIYWVVHKYFIRDAGLK